MKERRSCAVQRKADPIRTKPVRFNPSRVVRIGKGEQASSRAGEQLGHKVRGEQLRFFRNPKPETRNPKPETRNPKPETRNPTRDQGLC
jgi:hypothetical protein